MFLQAEGPVETEKTDTKTAEMVCDQVENLIGIFRAGKLLRERADAFGHMSVEQLLALGNGLIFAEQRKAVDLQAFFNGAKVKVQKTKKDIEIMLCNEINGAFFGAASFTGQRK